jgi:15-cis-phytoene desaturase
VTSADGSVSHLLLRNGEKIVADEYISAMPVDIMKRFVQSGVYVCMYVCAYVQKFSSQNAVCVRFVPRAWSTMPFFQQMNELEGSQRMYVCMYICIYVCRSSFLYDIPFLRICTHFE